MTSEIAALIAASIAAVVSLVSLYVNSRLTISRERRQQLWQYDLEQIRGVEQLAGRIAEILGRLYSPNRIDASHTNLMAQFENQIGRLRRYKRLNQAMRDFYNAAGRVLDTVQNSKDPREDKECLSTAFDQLAKSCDEVLEKQA